MGTVTTDCEDQFKNAIGGGVTKTRYKMYNDVQSLIEAIQLSSLRDQSEELPTIAGYKIIINAGNGLELPQLESRLSFFPVYFSLSTKQFF